VVDPRAAALAKYLRQRAADFSWLANLNDTQYTARAGMVLLDAAALAEAMPAGDERLCELSWRHRFTSAPHGLALFVETPAIRAAIQRPMITAPMTGKQVLELIVVTARGQ
jgi:hypothetical protein